MTVDRITTNTQAQYLLSQVMKANAALDTTQAQVASGKASPDLEIKCRTTVRRCQRQHRTKGP